MTADFNEADTSAAPCRWDTLPHAISEQRTFTDGRIVVSARKTRRGSQKVADYILRFRGDPAWMILRIVLRSRSVSRAMALIDSLCDTYPVS